MSCSLAFLNVTIASGQTTSAEVALPPTYRVVGIEVPAMTGVALTVTAADAAGGTFRNLYAGSNQVSLTVDGSGRYIGFTADLAAAFDSVRWLKLVSGASEGADRTLTLVCAGRD